jgi:hypothetical protein
MFSSLLLTLVLAGAPQETMIPEGTVLRVVLNEKISTKTLQENDPVLFTLADDVRAGGRRGPVLIPRGSSVVARVTKLDRAGHLIGRSNIDLRVEEIVTGDQVFDGLTTKVVDIGKIKGGKGEIKADGEIDGPVHRKRDAFLLLFPPTTIFQLMATPGRGPDVVLPVETKLYVKLMSPIYVERQVAETQTAPVPKTAAVPAPVPQVQQVTVLPTLYVPQPVAVVPVVPVSVRPQPVLQVAYTSMDALVSPVALYPDSVLQYVFAASTHPLEIYQASQWLQQSRPGTQPRWDTSIQALAGYPDLIRRLGSDIKWTESLGNAYQTKPNEVMDSVQRVRVQSGTLAAAASNPIQLK